MGLFRATVSAIRGGLSRTRSAVGGSLASLRGRTLDAGSIEEIESLLLAADIGVTTTELIVEDLRREVQDGALKGSDVLSVLHERLVARLASRDRQLAHADNGPTVMLVTGVNGAGKTTSIAKIAKAMKDQGQTVLLGAADTFRAGAVSQLSTWAERLGVDIVKGQPGGDPAAVAFDAVDATVARSADLLLVDTAGRLHTQEPLMRQLSKIHDVLGRKIEGAPHEVLLVLDATQGQNALQQARHFVAAADVTGIFLAKLDGTARGGIVFAIEDELDLPVKLVGLGERLEDVEPFDAEAFVEALLDIDP